MFYATHNQSYPSASEERAARWVGFGEHVGDALTHKLLDADTKKILYISAVRPSDSAHLNKCLVSDGGESSQTPKPIVFVRSRQDDSQSATKRSLPSCKLLSGASNILGLLKLWMSSKAPPMDMDPPIPCPIISTMI